MFTAKQYRAKAAEYTGLLKAASLPAETREFRRLEQRVTAGSGLMSSIPAFTCPKLSMRLCAKRPFTSAAKSTTFIMQGIDAALRKRGYPSVEALMSASIRALNSSAGTAEGPYPHDDLASV
jgi:hypothetical protein